MDAEIGCFMKPEGAMRRRKFGREFKVEAVKLVRERGVSVALAARDLDVRENVPRKWVKKDQRASVPHSSCQVSGVAQRRDAADERHRARCLMRRVRDKRPSVGFSALRRSVKEGDD